MALTREQLEEYAARYIDKSEMVDFPHNGDLFYFLERKIDPVKPQADDEGWQFGGYGVCINYELDQEAKPLGKWVWFSFVSLGTFPPHRETIKLQPPHVAKGMFQNADRTLDIRMAAVRGVDLNSIAPRSKEHMDSAPKQNGAKILKFRGQEKSSDEDSIA